LILLSREEKTEGQSFSRKKKELRYPFEFGECMLEQLGLRNVSMGILIFSGGR